MCYDTLVQTLDHLNICNMKMIEIRDYFVCEIDSI